LKKESIIRFLTSWRAAVSGESGSQNRLEAAGLKGCLDIQSDESIHQPLGELDC